MDCSMPGWTSKRYLRCLTISPPECSCGARLCSYQHMPCGGWGNTEIWSVVFMPWKFIVYNCGGETDSQGTATSSAKECVVAVDKSCLTLCHPTDWGIPGIPALHCSWICSDSCPLSQWHYLTISFFAAIPSFSSCLQSFLASGSFPMSSSSHQVARVLELQHLSFQCSSALNGGV